MTSCIKKTSFFILFFFFTIVLLAQKQGKTYRHQLLLISENDSYTFKIIDRYYTNGIVLRFSNAVTENNKKKKILNAEIGQAIYTAYDVRKNHYSENLDRPYTGFLYLKGGLSYLYKNETVFRWNIIAGLTGEAAKGQETQRIIHDFLGFRSAYGWEVQLRSDPVLNAEANFYHHLTAPAKQKTFDAFLVSKANLGTSFTNFSAGALIRLGLLEPSYNSALWDGRITKLEATSYRHHELFFYFEPSLMAQVYNATIQGGLFANQEGRYISEIQPFLYQHKFGVVYARKRWTTQLGYTYRTKEAKTMIGKEVYGTIAIGYRF